MSFVYKVLEGQLRTLYELFTVFTTTANTTSEDIEEVIDIEGQPIPDVEPSPLMRPTPEQLEQRPYRLRPRAPVNYAD